MIPQFKGIIEILYFVEDRQAAADWYAQLLNLPIINLGMPGILIIRVGSQDIFFHQADAKTTPGVAGQVAYWRVDDLETAVAHAHNLGATTYRAPIRRIDNLFMCQLKDPFGNVFGLIGK